MYEIIVLTTAIAAIVAGVTLAVKYKKSATDGKVKEYRALSERIDAYDRMYTELLKERDEIKAEIDKQSKLSRFLLKGKVYNSFVWRHM